MEFANRSVRFELQFGMRTNLEVRRPRHGRPAYLTFDHGRARASTGTRFDYTFYKRVMQSHKGYFLGMQESAVLDVADFRHGANGTVIQLWVTSLSQLGRSGPMYIRAHLFRVE